MVQGAQGNFHPMGGASLSPGRANWCLYVFYTVGDGGRAKCFKCLGSEG